MAERSKKEIDSGVPGWGERMEANREKFRAEVRKEMGIKEKKGAITSEDLTGKAPARK